MNSILAISLAVMFLYGVFSLAKEYLIPEYKIGEIKLPCHDLIIAISCFMLGATAVYFIVPVEIVIHEDNGHWQSTGDGKTIFHTKTGKTRWAADRNNRDNTSQRKPGPRFMTRKIYLSRINDHYKIQEWKEKQNRNIAVPY